MNVVAAQSPDSGPIGVDGKEEPRTLDTSRDYGIVCGDARGIAFEQDGILFRSDGTAADRE
jgi:hypothetical protein